MDFAFLKYEGLGNDFIVVDAAAGDEERWTDRRVAALCDRRFGIGADGVLLVLPARDGAHRARMVVRNADGSTPEMCGNGLRCVALHVARTSGGSAGSFVVETDAGPRACDVRPVAGEGRSSPQRAEVTLDMGPVRWTGDRQVSIAEAAGDRIVTVGEADAGNPHAVLFGSFDEGDLQRLGPALTRHAAFPRGANIELARVAEDGVHVLVWERGVGPTLACGTGACATVAVACGKGLLPADVPVAVFLPGGALEVTWRAADGHAVLKGPARLVYTGAWPAALP